jgi:hypothetical protein
MFKVQSYMSAAACPAKLNPAQGAAQSVRANYKTQQDMRLFTLILILLFAILTWTGKAQNVIYNQNLSEQNKNLRIDISSNMPRYSQGDTIFIKYRISNLSSDIQRIILKEYWSFPMGMTASIRDSRDSSICKYPTRHMLSSQLYTENELMEFEKAIEPGKIFEGQVALQKIPVFCDRIKNNVLPIDSYKISLSFFGLISNTIMIKIKE